MNNIDTNLATYIVCSNGMLDQMVKYHAQQGNLTCDKQMAQQAMWAVLNDNFATKRMVETDYITQMERWSKDIMFAVLDRVNWAEVAIHIETRLQQADWTRKQDQAEEA